MNSSVKKAGRRASAMHFEFRLNPLAAACAIAIFAVSAQAQTPDPAAQEAAK